MTYGLEIYDQIGRVTEPTARTARIVGIVSIPISSSASFNVSLAGVEFNGSPFMYFVANETGNPDQGVYWPNFSYTATQATVTARGVSGTAYVGVM